MNELENNNADTIEISENTEFMTILDDYIHLVVQHDEHRDFDFIVRKLHDCNILTCLSFQRLCKNTQRPNELPKTSAWTAIIDKMHCYFKHCYDIGNRLSPQNKWLIQNYKKAVNISSSTYLNYKLKKMKKIISRSCQKYNNINDNKHYALRSERFSGSIEAIEENDFKVTQQNLYCYGYEFEYETDDEKQPNISRFKNRCIKVSKRYSNLKTELTQNPIVIISPQQFAIELEKAQLHFDSEYCRTKFRAFDHRIHIKLENILSLMFYCNYTDLQYQLSQTYSHGYDNVHDKGYLLHHNLYHWGRNLQICVRKFGTAISDVTVQRFYHGMSQKLNFPKYINQYKCDIIITSPLSTSSSLEVVTHFANNNGLVLQFGADGYSVYSKNMAKFFCVSWLSDYGNEWECLFLQNKHPICIMNIIDVQYGYEYGSILTTLKMLERILDNNYQSSAQNKMDSNMQEFMSKIIKHRLSSSESMESLNGYAKQLIKSYFDNKTSVNLNVLILNKCPSVSKFLLENNQIKFRELTILVPNVENITMTSLQMVNDSLLDDILQYKRYIPNLKSITFDVTQQCTEQDIFLVNAYQRILGNVTLILEKPFEFKQSPLNKDKDKILVSQNDEIMKLQKRFNDYMFDVNSTITKLKKENEEFTKTVEFLQKQVGIITNDKFKQMKQWMTHVVKMPQYIDLFVENGLDNLDKIKRITMNELQSIGVSKIGHRIWILNAINDLENQHQP